MAPVRIAAGYVFAVIHEDALASLQEDLVDFGKRHGMHGLTLIATEGFNATVSGTPEAIASWKAFVTRRIGAAEWKDSVADEPPFTRWSVKVKPEIVALKQEGIAPAGRHRHLTPEEWQRTLEEEDVIVLDTRNDYETAIGMFRNAVDPVIASFSEFPAYVEKAELPKSKKILMYCTGGIRCEKAILEMEKQGYDNVYQLEGGILAYLEKFPQQHFEGECFVFDHRVAVDQHLQPSSTYGLCPHCGHAGIETVRCMCGTEAKVCSSCLTQEHRRTCSKRCANDCEKTLVSA